MWHYLETTTTNMGNAITSALTFVASKAQMVIEHLYMVLVRQQMILGLQQLLNGLFWIIIAIVLWRFSSYVIRKRSWAKLDKQLLIFVILIALFVSISIGFQNIISSLPRLLNPEYYAIQDAMRMVQEVRK